MSLPPTPNRLSLTLGAHGLRMGQAAIMACIGGLIPVTAKELDFAVTRFRLPLLSFAVGFLVGLALVYTPLMPKRSRFVGAWSGAGMIGAMVLWGTAGSLWVIAVAFFVLGVSSAWQELSTNPMMEELYPKHFPQALATLHALYGLWAFLGPLIARQVLSMGGSWRWLPLGTIVILFAAILLLALPGGVLKKLSHEEEAAAARGPFHVPWFLLILVVIYSGSNFTLNNWSPTVLQDRFAFSDARTASLIGGFYAMVLVGRFAWGWLTPRVGAARLLAATGVATAVVHGVLLWAPWPWLGVWSLWLTGFFIGAIIPLALTLEGQHQPGRMRQVTTAVFFAIGVGILVGPPTAGWVGEMWGLHVIFQGSLALCVIVAVMTVALWRREAGATGA